MARIFNYQAMKIILNQIFFKEFYFKFLIEKQFLSDIVYVRYFRRYFFINLFCRMILSTINISENSITYVNIWIFYTKKYWFSINLLKIVLRKE